VERADLERWIETYERAWRTAGTDSLAQLFAPDATYRTEPYREPQRGLEAIARLWEAAREGPDEAFTMKSEIVAFDGDTGVARIEVAYGDPVDREWRDIWIVRFDEKGRAVAFEEWPFSPEGDAGAPEG
jgi:ketosteroid isomerase-like protein